MCQKRSKSLRCQGLAHNNTGRASALKVFVAVLVCLAACKSNDLSHYVCAELLLACTSLDHNVCADLAVSKSNKLKRYDICSLMKKLIEGMLSVSSRLAKIIGPVT
ncbi:hypothetical protein EVA_12524 [gut metagenome]|uniref:Uncharacterized protein n=1 Tax=gut metagenome TaxID=749906 RepID=J9CH30_9ZZZZ